MYCGENAPSKARHQSRLWRTAVAAACAGKMRAHARARDGGCGWARAFTHPNHQAPWKEPWLRVDKGERGAVAEDARLFVDLTHDALFESLAKLDEPRESREAPFGPCALAAEQAAAA